MGINAQICSRSVESSQVFFYKCAMFLGKWFDFHSRGIAHAPIITQNYGMIDTWPPVLKQGRRLLSQAAGGAITRRWASGKKNYTTTAHKGGFFMTNWKEFRETIALDRGGYCWACDRVPWTQLHHMLIHKHTGHPELDTIENLCPVCEDCHPYLNGWNTRVKFWRSQCKLYGHERMTEWLAGLGLKVPPKFE